MNAVFCAFRERENGEDVYEFTRMYLPACLSEKEQRRSKGEKEATNVSKKRNKNLQTRV